jgi:hypothetical protein
MSWCGDEMSGGCWVRVSFCVSVWEDVLVADDVGAGADSVDADVVGAAAAVVADIVMVVVVVELMVLMEDDDQVLISTRDFI